MDKQKGMTLIGMILTMIIVIMAGVVLMRIVPVYLQHYSVNKSIHALNRIPNSELSADPSANALLLKSKLLNQFYVNGIDIPTEKIRITLDRQGKFRVAVTYQVIKPLVGNISLLFNFDESQEVNPGGE
ncbi:DUF4845 domain-containing protein [Legionella nagasakiensis]|uniref:DUF4845 domain-containing protein n=1 Tax=Legionella nagasakiensis TaxID=535290 RepID=UPI001054FF4B|nr:DUF4845 domain-containing protein [Legionella nagasakiensis]